VNFLEACKRVALRCGVSSTGPATVIGQIGELLLITQWVQDSHEEICAKWLNWKFLWKRLSSTTTANQAIVSPPDDLGIWDFSAIRVNGELLSVEEYDPIKSDWEPSTETGIPTMAVILPDNSLQLDKYQRAIIGRAMMFYAGYQNAPEVKQEGLEMYQMAMTQLESHELPGNGYMHGVSTGSMDFRVIPE